MGSTRNGSGVSASQVERVRKRLRAQQTPKPEATQTPRSGLQQQVATGPEGVSRPTRVQAAPKRLATGPGGGGKRRKRETVIAKPVERKQEESATRPPKVAST